MQKLELSKSSLIAGLALILIAGLIIGYVIKPMPKMEKKFEDKSVAEQREEWMDEADKIIGKLAMEGTFNCCLVKPCWYCIQKTPGHGEGATCQCLDDVLNGRHPCGECIGEILEGHGLTELKPFYAKAIAHKIGAEHEGHLQEIIDDMYPEVQ